MASRGSVDSMFEEIAPEGRMAARTVAALLILTGLGIVAASVDELTRRCGDEIAGECVSRSSAGVLLTAMSVVLIGLAVVIWRRVSRRPTDAYGSVRYVWALGSMFTVASIVLASRIPAFTCDRGRLDDLLDLCMHPPTTSEPHRWLLAKQAMVAVAIVGGIAIGARPRWVRVTAPITAATWLGAMGWLVVATLVRDAA